MTKNMLARLHLCFTVLAAAATFAISLAAQISQPPAEGKSKPTPENSAGTDAKADPQVDQAKELLTSPDAVTAAWLRCSSKDTGCPGVEQASALLADFTMTLKTGAGDSALATAVKQVVSAVSLADAGGVASASYVAIHVARFADDSRKAVADRWFLAHRRSGQLEITESKRILGSHRLGVIFVHLNVPELAGRTAQQVKEDFADLVYRAIIKPKLPANVEHLLALLRIATIPKAEDAGQPVTLVGYGLLDQVAVPSDVTIFGMRSDKLTPIGHSIQYDNEGKYLWDAGVAVPVNKLTLLDYSEENNVFSPKSINKQSIYGVVDLYPWPVDIKAGSTRYLLPRAMLGIGLTGRPGDNFLVGGSWGIPQLQFFVGSAFAAHRVPIQGTTGTNRSGGQNFEQRYGSRLSYGINVPVLSVLKKLTGAAKAK